LRDCEKHGYWWQRGAYGPRRGVRVLCRDERDREREL
jgi:hypothetical protein